MRVTVCELPDDPHNFAAAWPALLAHVRAERSDLLLLPEMPFAPWLAGAPEFDLPAWQAAETGHTAWLERLGELALAAVAGSRPLTAPDGQRSNMGFLWSRAAGQQDVHAKYYLPDEEGFWEASWYQRGPQDFSPAKAGPAKIGFLICTELWFFQQARAYGQQGVHLLLTPRATLRATREKWLVAGRAAALSAGAYSLSSNRVSLLPDPPQMGGLGWIVDPEGAVLAVTSAEQPFATVAIDLALAEAAKSSYPRYVLD